MVTPQSLMQNSRREPSSAATIVNNPMGLLKLYTLAKVVGGVAPVSSEGEGDKSPSFPSDRADIGDERELDVDVEGPTLWAAESNCGSDGGESTGQPQRDPALEEQEELPVDESTGFPEDREEIPKYDRVVYYLQGLHLNMGSIVQVQGIPQPGDELKNQELTEIAHRLREGEVEEVEAPAPRQLQVCFAKGIVEAREPCEAPGVEERRLKVLEDYKDRVFRSKLTRDLPPIRGPFGEAEINLKPGAKPVKQRMFHITGERKDAWERLTDEVIESGKVEPGVGAWSSPSFPVPKKTPGEYRLVEDFRAVNENTEDDAHPLPRIDEMVQRQSEFKIWTSLDCKDGYHQMPLKKEHRHITCMSTPKGTYQWRVQVMGLKNAGAQFQRMMEWVLQAHDCADPYIDDIIIGSTGTSEQEIMDNHERDLRAVLETLAINKIYVDPKKAHLFMKEVEFCGHVLREGRRSPAPGKLRVIQNWEAPRTVTQLRGF